MYSLLQIFVSYNSSHADVENLQRCISELNKDIVRTAILVNDYRPELPISQLASHVDYFLPNPDNLGYGATINRFVRSLEVVPDYLAFLNTDIRWHSGTFEKACDYMDEHNECVLLVPKIINPDGSTAYLCKRNPTILALVSRRFIPDSIKTKSLLNYDKKFCMADLSYSTVFEAPYLSGCCMITRSSSFLSIGGFDERFFLYLEDADLTRRLQSLGRCIHAPFLSIIHEWQRGSYKSLKLMFYNIYSAFMYFRKWGWKLY